MLFSSDFRCRSHPNLQKHDRNHQWLKYWDSNQCHHFMFLCRQSECCSVRSQNSTVAAFKCFLKKEHSASMSVCDRIIIHSTYCSCVLLTTFMPHRVMLQEHIWMSVHSLGLVPPTINTQGCNGQATTHGLYKVNAQLTKVFTTILCALIKKENGMRHRTKLRKLLRSEIE